MSQKRRQTPRPAKTLQLDFAEARTMIPPSEQQISEHIRTVCESMYRCVRCGALHSGAACRLFSDKHTQIGCPACGAEMREVFGPLASAPAASQLRQ